MTTKERYDLLLDWSIQYMACDEAWTGLEQLFRGLDTEAPAGRAVWMTFEKYTKTLSALVGDDCGWLDWYCWENDMGKKEFPAKAASWKRHRKIKCLRNLCQIIEADIEC